MENLIRKISADVAESCKIDLELFNKYNVKRGLRNADHTGVLVGLTNIGDVVGYTKENNVLTPIPGKLMYRGIDVEDLVRGATAENRHAFEEVIYLLLTGKLPGKDQLTEFHEYMSEQRILPESFTKTMILNLTGKNIMNMLARSVLGLYAMDDLAEDNSLENVLRQSLSLIAKFPTIIAYTYHTMRHAHYHKTLSIRHPQPDLSVSENFLYLLKGPGKYTRLDADILDLSLILHAEHGGGNNSSFTIRVTSSTGSDTYSTVSSALASLKGPLHGGANHEVLTMMDNIKKNIKDWSNEKEVEDYLWKILKKEAFDRSGKIYGIGHAVYTVSDPRAVLLKEMARKLADEKKRSEEYGLYESIEKLTPQIFYDFKGEKTAKRVCANVDFYSGFVYSCIGLREELYTPLFAMSRIAGWCAHRIEELNFDAKRIIRPAYKNVYDTQAYESLDKRD